MADLIINTNTLPEPLIRIIRSKKVKINEINGIVNLIPVPETIDDCPLRGLAADSKLTVEKFFAMTHDENEIPSWT